MRMKKRTENSLMADGDAKGYSAWIAGLKTRYRAMQLKAASSVNAILLEFYWELGRGISARYDGKRRNARFFEKLSADLRLALPEVDGFSPRNLKYMLDFYEMYRYPPQAVADNGKNDGRLPQVAADNFAGLFAIPWGHHRLIIDKCRNDIDEKHADELPGRVARDLERGQRAAEELARQALENGV